MPVMSVQSFKTLTGKNKSIFRGSMSKIDAALENYHQRFAGETIACQIDLLYAIVEASLYWLKKKEFRSEFSTNRIGMKSSYFDQNFLQRRTEVTQIGNTAITEIFRILEQHGIVNSRTNTNLRFDRQKLLTLGSRRANRPELKAMEAGYSLERKTYLSSGKTKAISGSSIHGFHEVLNDPNADLSVPISKRAAAAARKDVDTLSAQDWLVLEALSRKSGDACDVVYKDKQDRLAFLATADDHGLLRDCEEALISNTNVFDRIFAMDRYGNLFVEPADIQHPKRTLFNHSSFNAGNDVMCAGVIKVDKGVLTSINNASGHYKPTRKNLHECVVMLNSQRVNLMQAQVGIMGTSMLTMSATAFLATG